MNQHLQKISGFIEVAEHLSAEEKTVLFQVLKDADRDFAIAEFKLGRAEKVRRTTMVLLEETIEELEQKRKAVEAQNKELGIESSLERMRAAVMGIRKSDELITVAESLYKELRFLGFADMRNAQVVIPLKGNKIYLMCMYSEHSADIFEESRYETAPIVQHLYDELETSKDALYQREIKGADFEEWLDWRKATVSSADKRLLEARAINFYMYAVGYGHLGISAYRPISDDQLEVLKRFRNVFELSYRRFMDITKTEEQAMKILQEKEILEKTLRELKDAQKQLIQSEKMASLGELTAGIAHEIQNPLNFVNNFSEVSKELLEEMKEELDNGNRDEVKELAADVIQNLERINYHGKRADAIVKGMLQHSRQNTGEKEAIDINALCDEYLRLAYHGLRAKDTSFNATLKTDYEPSIGKVEIVPQDMGRVFLNLITNALYAVDERRKSPLTSASSAGRPKGGTKNYDPTVWVSTELISPLGGGRGGIKISVKDNGNGIPTNVLDKIFQPFFTTKPAGQGTGLGLSMSYDIVKAHGGELKVETTEGSGTKFIVQIPLNN